MNPTGSPVRHGSQHSLQVENLQEATTNVPVEGYMGPSEYFEKREHNKLHEKLDFVIQQLARVDRNVKCLALTDGANLALQTMMDATQLSDFDKLRRNTLPARSQSK